MSFCGWGCRCGNRCDTCYSINLLTRKQQYRRALAQSKVSPVTLEDDVIKKPMPGQQYGPVAPPFCDPDFQTKYPLLTEYLFTCRWADGSNRVTSTLSIFTDGESLKVVLNDRDNNRSAFFSDRTWALIFDTMEMALKEDRVDWKSRGMASGKGDKVPY